MQDNSTRETDPHLSGENFLRAGPARYRHPDRVVEAHLDGEFGEGATPALQTRPLRDFKKRRVIIGHLQGEAGWQLNGLLNLGAHDGEEFLLPLALLGVKSS